MLKNEIRDPEPISLAIGIFSALAGAGGLIIAAKQHSDQRRRDRAVTRSCLYEADRALNRLDEAYRTLISILDEHGIINAPMVLGSTPLYGNQRFVESIDRLRSNIFYSGRDLQNALVDLSSNIGPKEQETLLSISGELNDLFQRGRHSERFLEFLIAMGRMIELITIALYKISEQHNFRYSESRIHLIEQTLNTLESWK